MEKLCSLPKVTELEIGELVFRSIFAFNQYAILRQNGVHSPLVLVLCTSLGHLTS